MARTQYDYDLIILGSGGGGSVAAHIAAAAGKKVAIVEPAELGGDCPNWTRIPTGALLHAASIYDNAKRNNSIGIRSSTLSYNYPSIKAWKDLAIRRTGATEGKRLYEAEGIKVLAGSGHFISPHEITVNRQHYSAANFIIATGTHSLIPAIEGLEEAGYLTYKEASDLTRPPKSLFIIGASTVGCEFAELFSIFGSKIVLADITPRLLHKEDQEISEFVRETFENERGIKVLTSTKVIKIEKDGLTKRVYFKTGNEVKSIKVDEVLVTTGQAATTDIGLENAGVNYSPLGIIVNDQLQTSAKHIFAAGDVVGPYRYTHMAIYQGRIAINNIIHRKKMTTNYKAVPRAILLSPEIASVGLSEEECIKRDLRFKKAIAPISITSRANISNFDRGFVKIIADKEGLIIGASIASPHAGEMIHELTLAIQYGLSVTDIANTIHAFPTWSETIRIACNKITRL